MDPKGCKRITVEVKEGEVTLTGSVNGRDQKRAAEQCVESLPGVTEVINNLRVSRQDWSSMSVAQSRSKQGPDASESSSGSKDSGRSGKGPATGRS